MNYPEAIEIRPAPPLEIPQVAVAWDMPTAWFEAINSRGPDLVALFDCFLVAMPGQIRNLPLSSDFPRLFGCVVERDREESARAMNAETIRVRQIMRRSLWRLIEEASERVGVTCQALMLVMTAHYVNLSTIKNDEPRNPKRGNVVRGPWKPSLCGKGEG